MTVRVAINGYGRIGRMILRAIYEYNRQDEIKVVAINSSHPIPTSVHLTKYDTTHGRFAADVSGDDEHMYVNGDAIKMFADRNPENLAWGEYDVDVVLECTGHFKDRAGASKHFVGGAKKVLISSPGGSDIDSTIVYGVNDDILTADHTIVSCASCTTNCLAPMAKALNDGLGISKGLMTTIHAYTNDQNIIDNPHKDLRRARAAAQSIIPTNTGAAKALGLVLPELEGKLDGFAMRIPTLNVSIVDLTFDAGKDTTVAEVNRIMKAAADEKVLSYSEEQLVSTDFNHHPASSIFDATQTRVRGNMVKVLAWYDNEWGFSNRMIDTAVKMAKL